MPSTHQKKPDADSDPEFTVNYKEDVEMNKPQVVSVKTRENVKKVEIAVLYPNGQAKMYRSRMRDGEGKVELTVPMPGKFLSSVAVYGSGGIKFLKDFSFTGSRPAEGALEPGTRANSELERIRNRVIKLPDNFHPDTVRAWPNSTSYAQSLQNLAFSISDSYSDLKNGKLVRNKNVKIPSYIFGSGNFGTVFKITCDSGDYALKCFTRAAFDLAERYYFISSYLSGINLPMLVGFNYLPSAVRMISKPSQYYPVLRMGWIEGTSLNSYIEKNYNSSILMKRLADEFLNTMITLHEYGIAHGDLSGDNILVNDSGKLTLIDYDGMYVPPFSGRIAPEKGHEHFQHPARGDHYSEDLDNFSALVIYLSLYGISRNPELWKYNDNDGDKLIFSSGDFLNPDDSAVIRDLKAIGGRTRKLAGLLAQAAGMDPLWKGIEPIRIKGLR